MNYMTEIEKQIKNAIKTQQPLRLQLLRSIKNTLTVELNKKGACSSSIDEQLFQSLIKTMIKRRSESADLFQKAGRTDLENQERAEIALLTEHLPEQLSETAIEDAVVASIKSNEASSMSDLGEVLSDLRASYGASIDMKIASSIAKEKLK